MKKKVIAVLTGTLVTLILWAIVYAILTGIYSGNFPWPISFLVAFLCPLVGGYLAARLAHTNSALLGALSGFGAGLVVFISAASVSNLAPNTILAGVLMVVVGTLGGWAGAYLTRRGQKAG